MKIANEKIVQKAEDKTKEEIEREFLEVKNILKKEDSTKHNSPYIRKQISDNENLREVFLAVIKHNPALIGEISSTSLLTKPTCYSQLHKLLSLKLVNRRYYFDILKDGEKENGDKEIIKKFDDFTSKMPPNLKRYYQAKTSFWIITDFGKCFAKWALIKKEEFKEKRKKKNGN